MGRETGILPGEVVRPDVEERGARARGRLEVDAQVAALPTGRHVDGRLYLQGEGVESGLERSRKRRDRVRFTALISRGLQKYQKGDVF